MHVINMVLSLFSQEAVKQVTGEADRKECVSDVSTVIFFLEGGGTSFNLIPRDTRTSRSYDSKDRTDPSFLTPLHSGCLRIRRSRNI